MVDRAVGSFTVVINIPHFQAECKTNVVAENVHANVYLPPYFVNRYPAMHRHVACAVNTLIKGCGVPYITHCKEAYAVNRWQYAKDITRTRGGKPDDGEPRRLIPEPLAGSSRYTFWGYEGGRGPGCTPSAHPDDLLIQDAEILDLQTRLDSALAQIRLKDQQIEVLQARVGGTRYETPERSFKDDSTFVAVQSPLTPVRTQRFRSPILMPPDEERIPLFASLSANRLTSPPLRGSRSVSPQVNLPTSTPSVTARSSRSSFGFNTAKFIKSLGFQFGLNEEINLHQELKAITDQYEPEDWVAHLSTLETVGVDYAVDVAERMLLDVTDASEKKNKGKGRQ